MCYGAVDLRFDILFRCTERLTHVFGFFCLTQGVCSDYIAVALLWLVMTLAAVGSSDAAAVLDLAAALCLVIAGVGDHRLLRQTLRPPIEV